MATEGHVGEILVNGAVVIAESFGVSERVISISLISVGTSIPELSASLVAIYKKEKAISIGNLLGSNIFNIMAVLGITSMIQPIKVLEMSLINVDLIWMIPTFAVFKAMAVTFVAISVTLPAIPEIS